VKVFADHSQAQGIPGYDFITAGKAYAEHAEVDCFTAIIAVRVCHLMGKHQVFYQGKPVIFSFIFHAVSFSR
jgi:hypothetical protein